VRLKSKPWSKPLIEQHPTRIDPDSAFIIFPKTYAKFALEIGTGKGDFIVGKAILNPLTYFYGVEKSTTVIAFALKNILEKAVDNTHLIHGDFVKASLTMKDQIFDEIYLNFSDPWPKVRHEKRRLTAPGILEKITRVLKVKGKIYLKTDNPSFFDFSLMNFSLFPYTILKVDRDYQGLPDDVQTEYEKHFRSLGQTIHYLVVERTQ